MSLPAFSTQSELFSTAVLSTHLFAETDRYRLFAKLVYPHLARARSALEKCYCPENGRVALEPVLMLGVSVLQELDGVPDRQAVELLRYHAGWNFALNRQLGDPGFHPTSLVNFRHRLEQHQHSGLAFKAILDGLVEAGLISRQCRQRLDSTQMFGRVAKMNRLDCVRETLRLALQELEGVTPAEDRPIFWVELWERYVESQVDFRSGAETLARKFGEAGADAWQLLQWLGEPAQSGRAAATQAQLLKRVFGEQFEVLAGKPAALEKESITAQEASQSSPPEDEPEAAAPPALPEPASPSPVCSGQKELVAQQMVGAAPIQPKGKGQLSSERVQNPHDPEATYAVKGQGQHKKEHVGYKVQVAESVSEATLAPGEPTHNFIVGIVTHGAHQSDELGCHKMEQEQEQMGLQKPPVQYADGAYISAERLVAVHAQGRELIGPAQPAPRKEGRYSVEEFQINVEERTAVCPAGKTSTQCSRLEVETTGKVNFRFEFSTHCHDCSLRGKCLGKDQKHRTIVVGEHHSALQARRQEQQSESFKKRMKHRNGIEGTQSELVRGHGMRRARYRGLAKVKLQNYFIGAACNAKRWIRREAWKLAQAVSADSVQVAETPVS